MSTGEVNPSEPPPPSSAIASGMPEPTQPAAEARPSELPEPTVSDEEIDAYLMRPLSDPLVDAPLIGSPAAISPPPPRRRLPPPVHGPKRLYRDPNGRIGGVASGLAHYFNVDVAIVRLLFLVILITTLSLPAYIIAWIAIPKAPTWPPPGPPQGSRINRLDRKSVRVIALILVTVIVLSSVPGGAGALVLPIILIGAGAFLLNQASTTPLTSTASGYDAAPAANADSFSRTESSVQDTVGASTQAESYLPPAPAWAYETTVPAPPAPPAPIKRRRRGRWLAALLVIPATFILAAILSQLWTLSLVMSSGIGETGYAPQSVEDIDATYSLGIGELVVDLTDVDFEGQTVSTEVQLGIGEMQVLVPEGVSVDFDGTNGIGETNFFGRTADGLGIDASWNSDGDDGTLVLKTKQSIGQMDIKRG